MAKLICKKVTYISVHDESAFFEWTNKIKCIAKVQGVGDSLFLTVPRRTISDQSLRELLALFWRYEIDVKQLAQFETQKNRGWFRNNLKAYWHKHVFP